MKQAQDIGLGYELNLVLELNNRSDGLGAVRQCLKGFSEDNYLELTLIKNGEWGSVNPIIQLMLSSMAIWKTKVKISPVMRAFFCFQTGSLFETMDIKILSGSSRI
jgi:uncharacterized Fe-S cluster-containing radical SAM superfamily protein